jgi:hypothetical protein
VLKLYIIYQDDSQGWIDSNNCGLQLRACGRHRLKFKASLHFRSTHGASAPSGPWPPSEDASVLLCLLLISSILLFLWSVMGSSGRRPSILFLVFPLVFQGWVSNDRKLTENTVKRNYKFIVNQYFFLQREFCFALTVIYVWRFYSARICKTQRGVTGQNGGKYLTDQIQGCWKVLSPTRKETSYSDRRFWVSYILFVIIIGGILVLFIYISITRLASNEIF